MVKQTNRVMYTYLEAGLNWRHVITWSSWPLSCRICLRNFFFPDTDAGETALSGSDGNLPNLQLYSMDFCLRKPALYSEATNGTWLLLMPSLLEQEGPEWLFIDLIRWCFELLFLKRSTMVSLSSKRPSSRHFSRQRRLSSQRILQHRQVWAALTRSLGSKKLKTYKASSLGKRLMKSRCSWGSMRDKRNLICCMSQFLLVTKDWRADILSQLVQDWNMSNQPSSPGGSLNVKVDWLFVLLLLPKDSDTEWKSSSDSIDRGE